MIWLIIGKTVTVLFLLLALVLSLTGFAGSVLAFGTAFVYGWATGFSTLTGQTLLYLAIIMVVAETVEVLSGTVGAKAFHASRQAVIGSIIGLAAGFLLSIVTFQFYLILIGLVIGTLAGELAAGRRDPGVIIRSIVGVLIGKVGGILVKSGLTLVMAVITLVNVFR